MTALTSLGQGSGRSRATSVLELFVYPEFYGARNDGDTDDSAAFVRAAATGKAIRLKAGAGYVVGDAAISAGASIEGSAAKGYISLVSFFKIKPKVGASEIFNLDGKTGFHFSGFSVEGSSIPLTSGGVTGAAFKFLHLRNTPIGSVGKYISMSEVFGCTLYGGAFGIRGLVDSKVTYNFIAAMTGDGISLPLGANDNIISNNKIEWCAGYGIRAFGTDASNRTLDNVITGNIIDRCAKGGIALAHVTATSISGNLFRRNASDNVEGDGQAHIFIQGNNGVITIGGANISRIGANDDGSGNTTPVHCAHIQAGSSTEDLSMTGNDFTGSTGAALNKAGTITKYRCKDNQGVDDDVTGYTNNRDASGDYFAKGAGNINAAATGNYNGIFPFMNTYTRRKMRLQIDAVDNTLGTLYGCEFVISAVRGGTTVTLTWSAVLNQTGTSGQIANGSGNINVTIGSVTVNSADISFTLSAVNGLANQIGLVWRLIQ